MSTTFFLLMHDVLNTGRVNEARQFRLGSVRHLVVKLVKVLVHMNIPKTRWPHSSGRHDFKRNGKRTHKKQNQFLNGDD